MNGTQNNRARRPLLFLLAAVLLLTVLTSCESRTGGGSSSSVPASDVEGEVLPPESESEEPNEPETARIDDAGQIAEAREIIGELLDKAAVADEIYRGAIQRDDSPAVDLEGVEYKLVIDERFYTYDDLQEYLDSTFTKGGTAAARFEEMRLSRRYVSMNEQLHVMLEISPSPLMLGGWDLSSLELTRFDDDVIEAVMNTTIVGQPNGQKTLTVVRQNDTWLLTDSYFLD